MNIHLINTDGDRIGKTKVRKQTPMPECLAFSNPARVFVHRYEKCSERMCLYQQVTSVNIRSINTTLRKKRL